jgi:succinate-semialdehyde dehydrogenase/glutarate-semialdehyde dehydrogenase
MIIDGERISVDDRNTFSVVNPATEEVLGQLPLASAADLDRALVVAARGFQIWRKSTPQTRAAVLEGAAQLMTERLDDLAHIASMEQGKPIAEARIEVMMNVGLFRFYAGECQRIYGRTLVRPAGKRSTIIKVPVGPVAAFAPWNFPLANPGRKLGAPIAAGCSVIMKAAEETPASALGVLQALLDAGLPKEVAQAVFGVPEEVSSHLLGSPTIRKLSFTGSTVVGKHLTRLASEDMKRSTMELGGHAPVLVFDDVDIDQVLDVMVAHKYRNSGQVCVSSTRFMIHESIYQEFVSRFTGRVKALRVGNGQDDTTHMGPMANPRRLEAMDKLIGEAIAAGATLHCGGKRLDKPGYFYAPTVLADVPLHAQIMNEEPFGPVALFNSFSSDEDAIAEANRLPYGLAAYAWTNNAQRQRMLAEEVEVGMLGINSVMIGGPDTPFGGVKWSGHGHEDGPEGLDACLTIKAVHEG